MDVRRNEAKRRFEVELEGETAFADYQEQPGAILFPHTVVPEAFEGKGVGSALVKAGLAYARENGLKVMPQCSFFAGWIQRHPEAHDLVDPEWRERTGL